MPTDTPIILHQYDASPYSEKVRLVLGLKDLAWRSVDIPVMMPKPDLMPLTGGYRKTPVMQIGADIYCDTSMIIREIERRYPQPTLFPAGSEGVCWGMSKWTDAPVFQATVAIIFGNLADKVPESFLKDRQAFAGARFDVETMKTAAPLMLDHYRAYADWLECQLKGGQPFLLGASPSLSDLSAYMNIWFLRGAFPPAATLLDEFPKVTAWADRVAAIGHGQRTDITAQAALDEARAAYSSSHEAADPYDPNGRKPGDTVTVTPDDSGRVPVTGPLVCSSAQHIAIRHHHERVGDVVLHFPRAGFLVTPA